MSRPVLFSAANRIRFAQWALMPVGIVCLGIGLLAATGAVIDFDEISINHVTGWPLSVVVEVGIALLMMGLGPWCVLRVMSQRLQSK